MKKIHWRVLCGTVLSGTFLTTSALAASGRSEGGISPILMGILAVLVPSIGIAIRKKKNEPDSGTTPSDRAAAKSLHRSAFVAKMRVGEVLHVVCEMDLSGKRYLACTDQRVLIDDPSQKAALTYQEISGYTFKDDRDKKTKSIERAVTLVLHTKERDYVLCKCSNDFIEVCNTIKQNVGTKHKA